MIENINISRIYPHPENPRKDIGDIRELTESVKKNGVMQNLTVIPGHFENDAWLEEDYTLIIGHRRCAAAKAAGIKELPCRIIEGMSRKEQISTMLEENMQRNDLTIYEQAQGFQLMLDLGESVDTIVQKTGFSRSTVHHRLNIAKLDGEELKKKENGEFQLSLKDLYELEKIKDIETRNQILKDARDNRDLVWRAQNAVRKEKEKINEEIWRRKLNELGLKEMSKKEKDKRYTEFNYVRGINLAETPSEEEIGGTHYFCEYGRLNIYKEDPRTTKENTKEKEKERKRKQKQAKELLKKIDQRRKLFIRFVIEEKITPINGEKAMVGEIWKLLLDRGCGLYRSDISSIFLDKEYWSYSEEERKEAEEKTKNLTILQQLLIFLHVQLTKEDSICGYRGEYCKRVGEYHQKAYGLLEFYGWSFEDKEEESLIDGTNELYKEEKR